MRIVRAAAQHVVPMARLMAASPLLRRYRVTERGAKARRFHAKKHAVRV